MDSGTSETFSSSVTFKTNIFTKVILDWERQEDSEKKTLKSFILALRDHITVKSVEQGHVNQKCI